MSPGTRRETGLRAALALGLGLGPGIGSGAASIRRIAGAALLRGPLILETQLRGLELGKVQRAGEHSAGQRTRTRVAPWGLCKITR